MRVDKILIFLILSLLLVGVVLAQTNVGQIIVSFVSSVRIPEYINMTNLEVNKEYHLFNINVTEVGNNSWFIIRMKNHTGVIPTFRVKAGPNYIRNQWISNETLNFTTLNSELSGGQLIEFYISSKDVGTGIITYEVDCNYCNISKGNNTEFYNGNTTG